MPVSSLIVYEFSKSKIEALDFMQFLKAFTPERFDQLALKQIMNSLFLFVSGWDEDPRELYLVPKVRRFYRSLHKQWPYSLYFLNLNHDSLRILVFCCLENLTAIAVDGRPQSGVQVDPVELARFLATSFPPMNLACELAGLSEDQIFERTRQIFQYFGLLFLP